MAPGFSHLADSVGEFWGQSMLLPDQSTIIVVWDETINRDLGVNSYLSEYACWTRDIGTLARGQQVRVNTILYNVQQVVPRTDGFYTITVLPDFE